MCAVVFSEYLHVFLFFGGVYFIFCDKPDAPKVLIQRDEVEEDAFGYIIGHQKKEMRKCKGGRMTPGQAEVSPNKMNPVFGRFEGV